MSVNCDSLNQPDARTTISVRFEIKKKQQLRNILEWLKVFQQFGNDLLQYLRDAAAGL